MAACYPLLHRNWRSVILIFLATAVEIANTYAPNPPYCATRVAGTIKDLVAFGSQISYSIADCSPPGLSKADCAGDVFHALADLQDAATKLAEVSFGCANVRTDCEIVAIESTEFASKIAIKLIAAASTCDADEFLCAVNLVDLADAIVHFVSDIYTAVKLCSKTKKYHSKKAANLTWGDLPFDTGLPYAVPYWHRDGGENLLIINQNEMGVYKRQAALIKAAKEAGDP
eukprot:TRINITY_DN25485_c0_g1_i1.p1 TRINITY_DN25485_c0_g1~~TRINITY_DN25485_c0_g1_i1.p1  ORF type:complete len:240 (-),score=28.68 TRINITY_DN25485_c0_g1_i1:347-1033(-)